MSVLPLPEESIARIHAFVEMIMRRCPQIRIPLALKKRFAEKWGHDCRIDVGYVELCTGSKNFFPVLDRHILFCAFATDLYDIYDVYMKFAGRIRDAAGLSDAEWKRIGEDEGVTSDVARRIVAAVTSLPDLDAASQEHLRRFLTDSKKEREIQYGCFKGLSRADAFQPVAAAAMDLRKDNFSIINDVIRVFQKHRDVRDAIALLTNVAVLEGKGMSDPSTLVSLLQDAPGIGALAAAAASKPLAVLTGGSGNGKTRMAKCVGGCLAPGGGSVLVPVGADWTDNRNVLGFVNHLRQQEGRAMYQCTPVLDLMLDAAKDPEHPYFLILDEMNLSHVERYFSDFLSKMESQDAVVLHSEGAALMGSSGRTVPEKLPKIPDNLFVIGTVNVDETTYMFSPKVLDRANVIEFRMDSADVDAFLANGRSEGGDDEGPSPADRDAAGRAFLELSLRARGLRGAELADPPDLQNVKDALKDLFSIMQGFHMEFAYRTMNEVLRYARVSYELTADKTKWSWQDCMDVQILQKILPKLHGSRRKIEPVLVALATFCQTPTADETQRKELVDKCCAFFKPDSQDASSVELDPAEWEKQKPYPRSWRKLAEMLVALRRDQFVSFIQ